MRLPRAARQSPSVAQASADRRSSVFHAFAAGCVAIPIRGASVTADRRSSVFHAFAAGCAAIPIRGASVSRPSLERFPCVCCRGPRGNPNPWRERQPTVARALSMRLLERHNESGRLTAAAASSDAAASDAASSDTAASAADAFAAALTTPPALTNSLMPLPTL